MNPTSAPFVVSDIMPLHMLSDSYVQWVFDYFGQDKRKTAKHLRITVRSIYHRIDDGRLKCTRK